MSGLANLIIKPNRFPEIPKVPGVYVITDTISGKSYVGSSANVNTRIANYFCKSGKRNKALNQLNHEFCTFRMVEDCRYLSKIQRLELELEWIYKLGTVSPNGFNQRCPVTNVEFKNIGREVKVHKKRQPKIIKVKAQKVIGYKKPKEVTNYGKQPVFNKNVIKNY